MEFPNLGEYCSKHTCKRLDFLPLKCDACSNIFCGQHVLYSQHSCPSAYKKDVQVPVCPLCNSPVPLKRGVEPDVVVSMHIDNDCKSESDKTPWRVFSHKCSVKGCKVREIIQIKCAECHNNYCLGHRHISDHACTGRVQGKLPQQSIPKSRWNRNNPTQETSAIRQFQGTMTEEEALEKAMKESLKDVKKTPCVPVQSTTLGNSDRCRLS